MFEQTRKAIAESKRVNTHDHTWALLKVPQTQKTVDTMYNSTASHMKWDEHYDKECVVSKMNPENFPKKVSH